MRRYIAHALYAATAAGITLTLTALGLAWASAPAAAAAPSLSSPVFSTAQAGYASTGRWSRLRRISRAPGPVLNLSHAVSAATAV